MKESRVEELINKLYDMIEESARLPLGYCSINREKIFDLVDEIKNSIPGEVQMAKEIVAKRDAVIASAEKEAAKIKAQSEETAKRLVNENEITVEARKRAAETIENAEKRSQEIMRVAVDYCNDAMRRADEAIAHIQKEMKVSITQFKQAVSDRK